MDHELAADGWPIEGPARLTVRATALMVVATVAGIGVVVATLVERDWMDSSTRYVVPLVAAALGVLWLSYSAKGVTAAAVLAGAAVPFAARRLAPVDEPSFSQRVTAGDLPPVSVYALVLGSAVMFVGCVATAVVRRRRPGQRRATERPHATRAGVVTGGQASVLLFPLVVLALAPTTRAVVDRISESGARPHTLIEPAETLDDDARAFLYGPDEPTAEAWRSDQLMDPGNLFSPDASTGSIPGWDMVVATSPWNVYGDGPVLTAIRASDGQVMWTYQAGTGPYDTGAGVGIDPEAGKVLLVNGNALALLDLATGEELRTGRLPDGLECTSPVTDRPFDSPDDGQSRASVMVGPVMVMGCPGPDPERGQSLADVPTDDDRLVTFDIAEGDVQHHAAAPMRCRYATSAGSATTRPVILRWGWNDGCGVPTIVAFDASGDLETLAELESPAGITDPGCADFTCELSHVVQVGDTVLLSLIWGDLQELYGESTGQVETQLVALSADGELRWSAPDYLDVVASTEDTVVGVRGESWSVVRLSDGRDLASDDFTEAELAGTELSSTSFGIDTQHLSDGTRLYTVGSVNIVVRSVDDLSVLATVPVHADFWPLPGIIARDGNLIIPVSELFEDDEELNALRLIALTDP